MTKTFEIEWDCGGQSWGIEYVEARGERAAFAKVRKMVERRFSCTAARFVKLTTISAYN